MKALITVLFLAIVTSAIFLGMAIQKSQVTEVPAPAAVQPAAKDEAPRPVPEATVQPVSQEQPAQEQPAQEEQAKEVVKETVIEKTYVEKIVVVPGPPATDTAAETAYAQPAYIYPPPPPPPPPVYVYVAPPVYSYAPVTYGNPLPYGQNFQWAYRAPLGGAGYGHFHGWR